MNIENIFKEISDLIEQGRNIYIDNHNKSRESVDLQYDYNKWYTKSLKIIKRYLPDRLKEFKDYYEQPNYIKDYLVGDPLALFENYFIAQIAILTSVSSILTSFYQDMDSQIYFEYQEDELKEADKLLKISVRAAGAVAGVVLEKHLKRLCSNNGISGADKKTLGKLIQLLSSNEIISTTENKMLTYIADIRNKCDHSDKGDPTELEVKDLIGQTRRFINLKN